MTYFLDFDRTLFDTSAFLAYIVERDGLDELRSKTEVEMAARLNGPVAEGAIRFEKDELAQFLFPDAAVFLKAHGKESVIVTAGNPALQRAKCENVFASYPIFAIIYADDERKGPVLAKVAGSFPKPWIFIDDKPAELESVVVLLPEMSVYQSGRGTLPVLGAYPVIHSLAELP